MSLTVILIMALPTMILSTLMVRLIRIPTTPLLVLLVLLLMIVPLIHMVGRILPTSSQLMITFIPGGRIRRLFPGDRRFSHIRHLRLQPAMVGLRARLVSVQTPSSTVIAPTEITETAGHQIAEFVHGRADAGHTGDMGELAERVEATGGTAALLLLVWL